MNHPNEVDHSFHHMRMITGCHGKYSEEVFGQIDEPKHTVYYLCVQIACNIILFVITVYAIHRKIYLSAGFTEGEQKTKLHQMSRAVFYLM